MKTKTMQALIQASTEFMVPDSGEVCLVLLEMLMSMRKTVTSSPILPGMTSTGMKKEMREDRVRPRVGMKML